MGALIAAMLDGDGGSDVGSEARAFEGDLRPPPRRRAAVPRRRPAPSAVTERIRPPFVTSVSSRIAVPPWKTSAPAASASSMPVIAAPV